MLQRWLALLLIGCVQPAAPPPPQPVEPLVVTRETTTRTFVMNDACRNDIPDCVAACAMRETGRTDFIDYYDRKCAAAVMGKNPSKAVEPAQTVSTPPRVRTAHYDGGSQDLGF